MDSLRDRRHLVLDLDGSLYLGEQLLPDVPPLLKTLEKRSIGFSFITNNFSLHWRRYVAKLATIGIVAEAEQVHTSAHVTIQFLMDTHPRGQCLFVFGVPGLAHQYTDAGSTIAGNRGDVSESE